MNLKRKDGSINTKNIEMIILGASLELFKLYVIAYTFYLSKLANLNIGIAACIWCITPFVTALVDYLLYGERLQAYHFIGMINLVFCAALISLSDIEANPNEMQT
jgi:drug/metabolite transporter (DMT)-like permease